MMVKFEFVQPVGTNELPIGLTIPREAIRAIKVRPYDGPGEGDLVRVFVSYMDDDFVDERLRRRAVREVAEGVMYVSAIERAEAIVRDTLPAQLESEQKERDETRAHIRAHEAMDALRDSAPYPGKEAKPPEEIEEMLRAERERQIGKEARRHEARAVLDWLHATGHRVVDASEAGNPVIETEVLVHEYAKQVPA